MNKPTKNTQYKIGENLYIQHYTNGSFAYLSERGTWINIPHELGEKLYQLKTSINETKEELNDLTEKINLQIAINECK